MQINSTALIVASILPCVYATFHFRTQLSGKDPTTSYYQPIYQA